ARSNELRFQHRRYWQHEFINCQVDSILTVRVLTRRWSYGIEFDIYLAALIHDTIDILIDGDIVCSVDYLDMCLSPALRNLSCHFFDIGPCMAGKKNFGTLCRQLPCNARTDRTSGPKHHRYFSP